VAIQDRTRLFREGFRFVLDRQPGFEVVASAATAVELVKAVAGQEVDVLVLELEVDDWEPAGLVLALRRSYPTLAIVGVVAGDDATIPAAAFHAGVRDIFPRNAEAGEFLRVVRDVPSPNQLVLTDRVVRLDERRPLLSHREIQVLEEIGAGGSTRLVARSMGISPKTVENHKQRIFSKLGVQNQAHAVAVAMRKGLLTGTSGPTLLPAA
jgi:DNA-binding NarL/FixJ family response regulator